MFRNNTSDNTIKSNKGSNNASDYHMEQAKKHIQQAAKHLLDESGIVAKQESKQKKHQFKKVMELTVFNDNLKNLDGLKTRTSETQRRIATATPQRFKAKKYLPSLSQEDGSPFHRVKRDHNDEITNRLSNDDKNTVFTNDHDSRRIGMHFGHPEPDTPKPNWIDCEEILEEKNPKQWSMWSKKGSNPDFEAKRQAMTCREPSYTKLSPSKNLTIKKYAPPRPKDLPSLENHPELLKKAFHETGLSTKTYNIECKSTHVTKNGELKVNKLSRTPPRVLPPLSTLRKATTIAVSQVQSQK